VPSLARLSDRVSMVNARQLKSNLLRRLNIVTPSDNRFISTTFRVMLFFLYWVMIIQLPQQVPSPQLDPSWASTLSYFAKSRFQFGTDIIFTFGPLGYLYTNFYSGFMLSETIVLELTLKAFIAFQLVTVTVRAGKLFGTILFLCTVFLSHHIKDYLFHFSILFSLITVCESQNQPWRALASLTFLAVLSLIKFSFLVMAIVGLFPIMIYCTIAGRWKLLALVAGQFVTSFLVVWIITGQSVTAIPNYLISSLHIATGYQKSMFQASDTASLIVGCAILAISVISLVGLAVCSDKKPIKYLITFLVVQCIFLSWRHGFLRAEFYHIIQYYLFSQLALISAWAVLKPYVVICRKHLSIIVVLALVLPFAGIFVGGPFYWLVLIKPTGWANLKDALISISNFPNYLEKLEDQLATAKARHALPKTKALVGRESVDVFGFEQAIALLNEFNYRPRPVFQSYSAYDSFLVQANQQYYLSDRAPRFVLFKLQSIDDRVPAGDDSTTLETILLNYIPVLAERGYLLLKRLEKPTVTIPRRLVAEKMAAFNDIIQLPASQSPFWIQIDWTTSWHEKLRELAYQSSEVNIEITTQRRIKQTFRLIEPLARVGFLLSPFLFDTHDVLDSITGRPVETVKSFTLKTSPQYSYSRFRYRIYALSEFPKHLIYPDDALRELRYWVFDRVPSRVVANSTPRITALGKVGDVFMARAPSEIMFDIPKSAGFFEGFFGMQFFPIFGREKVDQADFFVEFIDRNQKPVELLHRHLIPETNLADRQKQPFKVALPKQTSGQIRLRAIIPSDSDELGNKTYWSDLRFK
jgi:hypothetical protein